MDRRVTPPKRVTTPTWGPPLPCKQALIRAFVRVSLARARSLFRPLLPSACYAGYECCTNTVQSQADHPLLVGAVVD